MRRSAGADWRSILVQRHAILGRKSHISKPRIACLRINLRPLGLGGRIDYGRQDERCGRWNVAGCDGVVSRPGRQRRRRACPTLGLTLTALYKRADGAGAGSFRCKSCQSIAMESIQEVEE